MSDLEPIKGKVIIEYDGSGIAEAKKDLESLSDIVGGSLAESTGGANEALSSLDEQMSKSADSTSALVSSVGALEKPLQQSGDGITSVTEALGEHQSALADTGSAYESLQKPIESTTSLLEEAAPPMLAITQHAESMQAQMDGVNTGFAQISESLSQSVPLLPQFAASLHSVSEEFDPRAFGLDTFNENLAVFQDALSNPYPYQMIHQYLSETGQTWDDFSSSIGSDNAAFLDQMAAMPVASSKAFGAMSDDVQSVGQTFYEAAGQTEAFNKQWSSMADSLDGINKEGGVGTALYGPEASWAKLDTGLASTEESIGKISAVGGEVAGAGSSFGDLFSGLHQIAMPLMAMQMIGMAVGQVSSGIYNMAALAEGPAAHSVGSFTGAIDVLGQHMQQTSEQFSEGFGQGIKPMIDAMNNAASGQTTDFWSSLGNGIGQVGSLLGNVVQIAAGGIMDLGSLGFTMNPSNPAGNEWLKSGFEGLANQFMSWIGQPEPYPTTGTASSSVQIDLPAIQQSLTQSIAVMNAQATNPQYLAAQAYLSSQAGYAQLGQTVYDVSHTTGMSPFDYTPQAYQNAMANYALANGGSGYGLSDVDLNRAYFTNMLNNLPPDLTSGGCFPAGTRVRMADGSERPIETLRIGEQVLAHDGARQVARRIMDTITYLAKQTYELTFSDGNTLTLTDSHPIMTDQGWKSLSPTMSAKENPGLSVSALQVGDRIHAASGICTLLSVETRAIVQVYNLTVSEPHTYYANGVLVHNAKMALGPQIMQNVANTPIPTTDLRNSTLMQSIAGNFGDADLTHTFTATATWVGQGLTNTFTGVGSWVGQGLSNMFTGVASWVGNNLSNTFTGAASWVGQGLSNTFTGVAGWIGQNLSNVFTGVASWVGDNLGNTFTGVASWLGENLEHTFTGVASWVQQGFAELGNTPGFASGVENFQGGLAVVGEHGPELVRLPQGSSVYPQTNGFAPLSMGDSGGGMIYVTLNHTTTLNGKVVAQETIPLIAPMLRSAWGIRQ